MSIEQLPSGRWRVRWKTADGRHPGRTFDTKAEAKARDDLIKADKKLRRAQKRKQRTYTGHTIGEALYLHFDRKIKGEKWANSTRETNQTAWKHIMEEVGDVRVDHFDADDAEDLQNLVVLKLRVRGAARAGLISRGEAAVIEEKLRHGDVGKWKLTAEERDVMDEARSLGLGIPMAIKVMGVLSGGLKAALRKGWVEVNVLTAIDSIKPKDYQVRTAVPPIVVEAVRRRFLHMGDLESATLVSSTNLTGLRPQEALGLDRGQSIEQHTIKVFQADTYGKLGDTKTRRNRTVTKIPQVQEDLDAWYEQTPGWTLVFEENGAPWTASKYANWRKRVYNPVVEAVLGERILPYDLCRHAFVSLLLAAGRPLHEIADEAGHTVAVLSSHYALIIPEFRGKPPVPPEVAIAEARSLTDEALAREIAAWRRRRGTLPPDERHKTPK